MPPLGTNEESTPPPSPRGSSPTGQQRSAWRPGRGWIAFAIAVLALNIVLSARATHAASRERVTLFNNDVLVQAQEVRDARLFSYRHGDSTLLEELNAERTLDDLRLQHVDVLRENAHALLAVRMFAGQPLNFLEPKTAATIDR